MFLGPELRSSSRYVAGFPLFLGQSSTGEECLDRVAMVTVSVVMRDGGRAGSGVWFSLCTLGNVSGATHLSRATLDGQTLQLERDRQAVRHTDSETDRPRV